MSSMDDDRTVPFQRHGALADAPRPRGALLVAVQANVARELLLTLETDFVAYNTIVERAGTSAGPWLALADPACNSLGPGNAFWVAVRDSAAEVQACWLQRVWQNTSFVELVNQGCLLQDGLVPTLAMTLALAKLVQDFDIDYCFSLVPPETVLSGAAANIYRYSHMDFGGTLWRAGPAGRAELWIIHNARADIERELSLWSRDGA